MKGRSKSWRCLEEIIEYVRVAALLCHDTFTRQQPTARRKCKTDATLRKTKWRPCHDQQEYQRRRQHIGAQMQPGSAAALICRAEATRKAQTVNIRIARVATSVFHRF